MRPSSLATLAVLLSCLAVATAADEDKLTFGSTPYQVRPLEFTVLLPDGWQAQQDNTGMVAQVARDPQGMGFLVSREPMLSDPKDFDERWQATLGGSGIDAKVKKSRAGKHSGWSARWETDAGGGRTIEVHRIHVEDNEMLYNFSFTAPKGEEELDRLVDGVLRSFKFTGEKPELEFNQTAEPLFTRASVFLPKGYAPPVAVPGAMPGQTRRYYWVKMLEGYTPPHEAGRIWIDLIRQNSEKDAVEVVLANAEKTWGKPRKRPRRKSAKAGGAKGYQATAEFLPDDGIPKVLYTFAFRPQPGIALALTMVVDEREERLYKDIFKEFCKRAKLED